ncbi:MAG: hypothetical protein JKX75_06340 [Gammaproteobacteria bacterium]|nr:hypothetical protein [Gammaproteobacteria bacterium]
MELASQILTAQQQQQLDQLNQQFALYDQATTLALGEIDEEIAGAKDDYQRIQDNATILADGSRVYRDEENGDFYDEEDQRISDSDEIEARRTYKAGDSSRQTVSSADNRIEDLQRERQDVTDFQKKQSDLEERLENNPQDAAEIKDELDNMPAPRRVQNHHQALSSNQPQEIRSETGTSFANEISEGGIQAKNALRPAFTHASHVEQVSTEPAPRPEPDSVSPQSNPGMNMG